MTFLIISKEEFECEGTMVDGDVVDFKVFIGEIEVTKALSDRRIEMLKTEWGIEYANQD